MKISRKLLEPENLVQGIDARTLYYWAILFRGVFLPGKGQLLNFLAVRLSEHFYLT